MICPYVHFSTSILCLNPLLMFETIGTYQILLDRCQCEHSDHKRPVGDRDVAGDMVLGVSKWETAAESAGDYPGREGVSRLDINKILEQRRVRIRHVGRAALTATVEAKSRSLGCRTFVVRIEEE